MHYRGNGCSGRRAKCSQQIPSGCRCDAVMCEDFVGYYKRGPFLFYHLTAELSSVSAA